MQSTRLFATAFFVAALLLGGIALDGTMEAAAAPVPNFCAAAPVNGCGAIACQPGAGNCPNGAPFTHMAQQPFAYVPCNAVVGARCPNPLNNVIICFSGGYTLNAMGQCVLVCGVNVVAGSC